MRPEELRRLYDDEYAATYEAKFLATPFTRSDTAHEVQLLGEWLTPGVRWLDVACGTGYFLSRFPAIERAGLDLSPSMLAVARAANPDTPFVEGNFLDPHPEWSGRWSLVSCMSYAYGLVGSMAELHQLIANLASWTSSDGRCFIPLADPRLIAGVDLPYEFVGVWPGTVRITGIQWSYIEDEGARVHEYQLAPQTEVMQELVSAFFEHVELVTYPPAMPGWEGRRKALVGRGRRTLDP